MGRPGFPRNGQCSGAGPDTVGRPASPGTEMRWGASRAQGGRTVGLGDGDWGTAASCSQFCALGSRRSLGLWRWLGVTSAHGGRWWPRGLPGPGGGRASWTASPGPAWPWPLLQAGRAVITFLRLFVDIIVSSGLRSLCSGNHSDGISCLDSLVILRPPLP